MILHDFNKGSDTLDLTETVDGFPLRIRITRGSIPSLTERVGDVAVYIPPSAGKVKVESPFSSRTGNGPFVALLKKDAPVEVTGYGGPLEDLYVFEAIALPSPGEPPSPLEVNDHTYLDTQGGSGVYPDASRAYEVDGTLKKSGWYVHSMKVRPDRTKGVIGIGDAHSPGKLRDDEAIHCHNRSLEMMVPLRGELIFASFRDGGIVRQKPGMLVIAEAGETHALMGVNGDTYHVVAQGPSMFHANDRELVTPPSATSPLVKDYDLRKFPSKGM